MAGADIGGDASVEWTVTADNFRKNNPPSGKQNGNGWKHHGIDEVDIGPGHNFDISIKIPRDPGDAKILADTLTQAAAVAQAQITNPGSCVSFTLPIESQSPDQIQISWESAPVLGGHGHGNLMASKISRRNTAPVKKGTLKKSAKKTSNKPSKKASKGSRKKGK